MRLGGRGVLVGQTFVCVGMLLLLNIAWAGPAVEDAIFPEEPLVLSLEDSLRLATQNNPFYLREKEKIEQSAHALTKARHFFTTNPSSTIASTYTGGPGADNQVSSSADLTVNKNLGQGGSISGTVDTSNLHVAEPETEDFFESSFRLNFSQPLLRGAGVLVARESLTDAERQVIYAERAFELFKQDFVIEIASRYWRLLERKRRVESRREALKSAEFSRDMMQKRFDLGVGKKEGKGMIDALTAEVNFLNAQDDLNATEQSYRLTLDQFKLDLGIDIQIPVELVEEKLEYAALAVDEQKSIDTALARRLDLLTARDRLDDDKRQLGIARDALRTRLDFDVSYTVPSTSEGSFADQDVGDPFYSAGLTLRLPFDRTVERANVSLEGISYVQRERSVKRLADEIVLEVRSAARDLERADYSLKIQELNRKRAASLLELASLSMEQGDITQRDFDDARNDFIGAEDAYNAALVDFLIAKLQLRRVIGTLYVDTEISW